MFDFMNSNDLNHIDLFIQELEINNTLRSDAEEDAIIEWLERANSTLTHEQDTTRHLLALMMRIGVEARRIQDEATVGSGSVDPKPLADLAAPDCADRACLPAFLEGWQRRLQSCEPALREAFIGYLRQAVGETRKRLEAIDRLRSGTEAAHAFAVYKRDRPPPTLPGFRDQLLAKREQDRGFR